MKKLITTITALAGLTVASYAQRSTEIATVIVSPTPDQIINCTDSFLVDFMFINNGPETVLTTDTIVFQTPEVPTTTSAYGFGPARDAQTNDTIGRFRYYLQKSDVNLLFNDAGNQLLEAPFSNGDYLFFVAFGRFVSDLTNTSSTPIIGTPITIDCGTTSINNLAKANLNIFPNPAQGQINVNFEVLASNATLRVIDIMGRTILTKEVAKNTSAYAFDISTLNNGAYYLELTSAEVRGTTKFVVSK